jgi:hypothetical protein
MGGGILGLAQEWNGKNWKPLTFPAPAGALGGLKSVSCLSSVWCVGTGGYGTYESGDGDIALIDEWNGAQWILMPTNLSANLKLNTVLWAVSCSSLLFCAAVGYEGAKIVAEVYR